MTVRLKLTRRSQYRKEHLPDAFGPILLRSPYNFAHESTKRSCIATSISNLVRRKVETETGNSSLASVVSNATTQTLKTFLCIHPKQIAAIDFIAVRDVSRAGVFLVLAHERRAQC